MWAVFWIMEGSIRHIIFCHLVPPLTKLHVQPSLRGCHSPKWKLSAASDNCVLSNVTIVCILQLPYSVFHFLLEELTMHNIVFYFWETPCRGVCRVECKGFTERLCPPGPSHTAAVSDKADPLHKRKRKKKKKTCSLLPPDCQPSTPVLSLRRKCPTSKCQPSQELSPLFPQRKMSDGWWFSALWFHRSGDRTVWER